MSDEITPEAQDKVERLSDNVADLYLEAFSFTTPAAIIGYVDKKVCVTQTDNRHLLGILRTFDQYGKWRGKLMAAKVLTIVLGSIVLQDTVERVFLQDGKYAETYLGVLFIRGENILILGEVDIDKEDDPISNLTRVPYEEAARSKKQLLQSISQEFKTESKIFQAHGKIIEFPL